MQGVFEDGAGNAGVFVVERNERVPRYERHIERDSLVRKADLGEGEFTAKVALFKARKALGAAAAQSLPLQALVEDFEGGERTFNELGDGCRTLDMKDGEGGFRGIGGESCRERRGLGAGADGEILQSAGAVDADASGAEAADGHGNLGCSISVEGPL